MRKNYENVLFMDAINLSTIFSRKDLTQKAWYARFIIDLLGTRNGEFLVFRLELGYLTVASSLPFKKPFRPENEVKCSNDPKSLNTKSKKMPMLIISTNIETGSTDSLSVNVTM